MCTNIVTPCNMFVVLDQIRRESKKRGVSYRLLIFLMVLMNRLDSSGFRMKSKSSTSYRTKKLFTVTQPQIVLELYIIQNPLRTHFPRYMILITQSGIRGSVSFSTLCRPSRNLPFWNSGNLVVENPWCK